MNHNPLTYLALGDSYTIGEGVNKEECYPLILATKLNQEGLNLTSPHIIARTGWTTDELLSAIRHENPPNTYDLVSLLIGVNNQYRNYYINTYSKEFEELLEIAIQKARGDVRHVFVVSIPDYGVTPFAKDRNTDRIAKEIDDYNKIASSISQKHKVKYFDITPISRKAKQDLSLIAKDDLHPSGKMYAAWANLMLGEVRSMFG
jgi:lysophospholipase L1-like esterase